MGHAVGSPRRGWERLGWRAGRKGCPRGEGGGKLVILDFPSSNKKHHEGREDERLQQGLCQAAPLIRGKKRGYGSRAAR